MNGSKMIGDRSLTRQDPFLDPFLTRRRGDAEKDG